MDADAFHELFALVGIDGEDVVAPLAELEPGEYRIRGKPAVAEVIGAPERYILGRARLDSTGFCSRDVFRLGDVELVDRDAARILHVDVSGTVALRPAFGVQDRQGRAAASEGEQSRGEEARASGK